MRSGRFPVAGPESLDGYVRLGLGGPELSADDAASGLLVLDGTWRLAGKMEADFADVPVRTLPAWETAYPRVSKLYDDPLGGLATIEAVYAAHRILGRDVSGTAGRVSLGRRVPGAKCLAVAKR